jgi:D-beta-D-heptose 7-phosphate kinase/D-beta-D-heptose 1-phosphate adenosyltransferase
MTSLIAQFDKIKSPRILVLGDLILDRYTFGNAERVSPEAPVLVLRADAQEVRLGGAAIPPEECC